MKKQVLMDLSQIDEKYIHLRRQGDNHREALLKITDDVFYRAEQKKISVSSVVPTLEYDLAKQIELEIIYILLEHYTKELEQEIEKEHIIKKRENNMH